jgi:hypothetical protein
LSGQARRAALGLDLGTRPSACPVRRDALNRDAARNHPADEFKADAERLLHLAKEHGAGGSVGMPINSTQRKGRGAIDARLRPQSGAATICRWRSGTSLSTAAAGRALFDLKRQPQTPRRAYRQDGRRPSVRSTASFHAARRA